MPFYLLGKRGTIESVLALARIAGEVDRGGPRRDATYHYHRVAFLLTEIWPDYVGLPSDGLRLDVFETWVTQL